MKINLMDIFLAPVPAKPKHAYTRAKFIVLTDLNGIFLFYETLILQKYVNFAQLRFEIGTFCMHGRQKYI